MSEGKKIGLAELLRALRIEIDRSKYLMVEQGVTPMLELKDAEVEVQFVVEREAKGGIGAELGLFAVEAGGKYHSENLQKLKLKLSPIADPSGSRGSIAGSPTGE
jgi:hypothetical protein